MKARGFGLGLRPDHYDTILSERPPVGFFEALTENYLVPGRQGASLSGATPRLLSDCSAWGVAVHLFYRTIGSRVLKSLEGTIPADSSTLDIGSPVFEL